MKLQIFLRVFGVPILLLIGVLIRLSLGTTSFRAFAGITFLFSVSMARLLTDLKYIRTITIKDDSIVITYLTQFMRTKVIEIERSAVSDVELTRRNLFSLLWSPALNIKVDGEWMSFNVLSKELYNDIKHQLPSANLAMR